MKRRNTEQKQAILKLFTKHHLLSGKRIADMLSLDQSTVYRNLERFVEDGLLREVRLPTRELHYELVEDHQHGHFVCRGCDRVESVPLPSSLSLPTGAKLSRVDVLLEGECKKCK